LPTSAHIEEDEYAVSAKLTGLFNNKGNPQCECHEVVVDVVKHAVRGIDLRHELSNHDILQNHSNTRLQEDLNNDFRHVEDSCTSKGGSTQRDAEVDEDDHELTSHEL
jgi:hypothetical protein